ncbi:MAG: sulfatase [Myxococcota bacterium]
MQARGLALALAAVFALACGDAGRSEPPSNLILISLDTLRADHLGCYGRDRNTSPAIDALAAAGVRFADASATSPWTLPSHASMLTGLYPSSHGVRQRSHRLPEERVTLAESLAEHGYQTFAVVNSLSFGRRFAVLQGFGPEAVTYIPEILETGGGRLIVNSAPRIVEKAYERLDARDAQRPFFLFLHFYDAHSDYTPQRSYRTRLVGDYDGEVTGSTDQLLRIQEAGKTLSDADVRFLRELYDAEIRELDDVLAGFFASLEARGRLQDTLIVLTSDHGEEFQEHGGLLHGDTQYQEVLAVPLILRGPGIPRGRVVTEPVSLVDVVPTVLAVLGVPGAGAFDGIDLSPSWADSPEPLPRRLLFSDASHLVGKGHGGRGYPRRMVRDGDEKLCTDRSTGDAELYDLSRDPGETDDLARRRPERVAELLAALAEHVSGRVDAEANDQPLSEQERSLLRSLGYVE